MNEYDLDFLRDMMQERMTRIYAEDHSKRIEEKREFAEKETRFRQAISPLSGEQKETVHHYMDDLARRSADNEVFFYRSGLLDGYRLCRYLQTVVESG